MKRKRGRKVCSRSSKNSKKFSNAACSELSNRAIGSGRCACSNVFQIREPICLIVELGMPDAEAMLPWRMELKVRRETAHQKRFDSLTKKLSAKERMVKRQDSIVFRVTDLRHRTGCTLEQAIPMVAAGDDQPQIAGLLAPDPRRAMSAAVVKADYMAGIKRAKETGLVSGGRRTIWGATANAAPRSTYAEGQKAERRNRLDFALPIRPKKLT